MKIDLGHLIDEIGDKGLICLPEVVSAGELREMSLFFNQYRNQFVPALVGKGADRKRVEEIRGDHTLWLDSLKPPAVFKESISLLDEMRLALNRGLYLGLKEFECHLARYPLGTFYRKHLDRFEKDSSRAFTFIFYLHEKWHEGDGGELIIYNHRGAKVLVAPPLPGSMIGFLSGDFPHEVRASNKERRSLTGWMHTKMIS